MQFNFKFSISILNHLGRGLYRSFATIIAEAISNSWDADAESVHVEITKDSLVIWDDGVGMDADDLQNKFLRIGYERRSMSQWSDEKKRRVLGRKGIGKLAYLSISDKVTVIAKKKTGKMVSVVMDNEKIDNSIIKDELVQQCDLPELDQAELEKICKIKKSGTQLVFDGLRSNLRRHDIRAILATQFHFSHAMEDGDKFEIFVKDDKQDGKIGIKDLAKIYNQGQFVWFFNEESKKKFFADMAKAGIAPKFERSEIISLSDKDESGDLVNMDGYVISVHTPTDLFVHKGEREFKASVSLFAGGRLRESELISSVSKARLPEYYLFGQIHVDSMDSDEKIDRFTSARDGVKQDDPLYVDFLKLLNKVLAKIISDWAKWRKAYGDPNHGVPKTPEERLENSSDDMFMQWLRNSKLVPRTEYAKHPLTQYIRKIARKNVPSYMECFIAENMMRHYIDTQGVSYSEITSKIEKYKRDEETLKKNAEITDPIKASFMGMSNNDINYMSSSQMAFIIDKHLIGNSDGIVGDAAYQAPIRNSLMHTSLLTDKAKRKGDERWKRITRTVLYLLGWIK